MSAEAATSDAVVSPILRQARFEVALLLRNGEQILLTAIIPVALLLGLTWATGIDLDGDPGVPRVSLVLAGVLAVAVLSSAFASLAITTGFDRRSGALLLLATTPLSRTGILLARVLATLAVVTLQVALLTGVAVVLGWRPGPSVAALVGAVAVVVVGTLSLGACGFALAGAVRAEATLAIANGVFLALLVAGGTALPPESLPGPIAAGVSWLPSAALGDALRGLLASAPGPSPAAMALDIALLAGWGLLAAIIARRTFRWD